MRQSRRHFSASQKAQIVRRHVSGKEPVSESGRRVRPSTQPDPYLGQAGARPGRACFGASSRPAAPRRAASSKARRAAPIQARPEERGHRRADAGARAAKKRTWGALNGAWVPHDTRDQVVDYVKHWSDRTELPARRLLGWLGLGTSKFHDWKHRYGKVNEHNGKVPRDWWLEDWEKQAIIDFHDRHPLEGYRRLTFMMLDDDVVAVSPASVYRVLKQANRLDHQAVLAVEEGNRLRAAARAP